MEYMLADTVSTSIYALNHLRCRTGWDLRVLLDELSTTRPLGEAGNKVRPQLPSQYSQTRSINTPTRCWALKV